MKIKKKHQILFFIARNVVWLLTMGAIALFPVTMNAGIQYTHHDFAYSGASTELCNACHTPHHANKDKELFSPQQLPLWNHAVTTTNYTLYSSPTLDAVPTQPTSISKLCLSCHDGTVAVDSFGGKTGANYIKSATLHGVPIAIGTKLTSHHPVSIRYDSALAAKDPKLKNPDTSPSGIENSSGIPGGGTISHDLLNGGMLECSSCHDVHVARGTGVCVDCHGVDSYPDYYLNTKSLVKSNTGSALCLTCHLK